MGLCAPNFYYDEKWYCKNLKNILENEEEKPMLDDDQKKIVVDQLIEKKNQLERKLGSFTEQAANVGKKLYDTLFELENVTDVLETMTGISEDIDLD